MGDEARAILYVIRIGLTIVKEIKKEKDMRRIKRKR